MASRLLDAAGNDCTAAAANIAQCPSNVTQAVGRGACNDVSAGNGRSADRQWLAADARPACGTPTPARGTRTCSPFSNNLYVIWTDSSCGNAPPSGMMVASSSDQGANWIGQALLGGTGANRDVRQVGIGIGANGDLYAGYHAQQYAGEPDGTSGQIIVYQSADGTATGLAGNNTSPFPAGTADITLNQQQCVCPGSTCAATGVACTFNSGACPGGRRAACECVAPDTCVPAAGLREQSDSGVGALPPPLADERQSDLGLAEPVHRGGSGQSEQRRRVRVDRSNPAGTVRDNMNVNYVIATNAATATPIWSAPLAVTPAGAALPATNQLFPAAVTGLSGACVTLAYYDDRSPNTNAAGNNMLDTFVTVNPNLWASSAWQAEVKINDVQFDPDRGAPDFFSGSFCVNTPTPRLRPPRRMALDEPHGRVQRPAAGVRVFVRQRSHLRPDDDVRLLGRHSARGDATPAGHGEHLPTVAGAAGQRHRDRRMRQTAAQRRDRRDPAPSHRAQHRDLVGDRRRRQQGNGDPVGDRAGPDRPVVHDHPGRRHDHELHGVNLGQAFAQDDCGGNVTITNNAPAQFPLGTTAVTWTAVDARGNVRTATPAGDGAAGRQSQSCCPPGPTSSSARRTTTH